MPLTVVGFAVSNTSMTIKFSDPVFKKAPPLADLDHIWWKAPKDEEVEGEKKAFHLFEHSALNPSNYTVFDPGSQDFEEPATLAACASEAGWGPPATLKVAPGNCPATASFDSTFTVLTVEFGEKDDNPEFADGSWVTLVVKNIRGVSEAGDRVPGIDDVAVLTARVPESKPPAGAGITKNVEDAVSYPILTGEVSFPPPIGTGGGGGPASYARGGGTQGIGQTASMAITDILGWKANSSDARGFLGALTQSFSLTEVEGHVESKWNPRSYTVQTDLAGGITGAQASLYARAKDAADNCLPLLDGLYPLDPNADPEYVKALREMAKSQIAEIVKQFGVVPPSILRVNTYFRILLGHTNFRFSQKPAVEADPDQIGGTLGDIRKIYGIFFMRNGRNNQFSNSIEDEQDITNFRVISDYMTSLLLTWLGNGRYFELSPTSIPAFLGTQLVLISRQLNVIAETVSEVRFALDSVFIGPNERQTLLLVFPEFTGLPAMYLEDVLSEITTSVTDELPRLMRDGGRIAITNNVLPVMQTLSNMAAGARNPTNLSALPDGYSTTRVRRTLDDLSDQLTQLYTLGQQVGTQVPEPQYSLKP